MLPLLLALPLSSPVTMNADGVPVAEVLRALSLSQHLHLTADAQTRGEIMVIDVQDVTLDWLLDSIAKANGAAWLATKNGYVLTQTAALRKADLALENANRAEILRRQLPAKLAPIQRLSRATLDGPPDPTERLAIRFASALGAEALAEIPLNTRVAWANFPLASSHRLTIDPVPVFEAYREEQKVAYAEGGDDEPPDLLPADRVVVSAQRSSWAGEAVVVKILDATGRTKLVASTILRLNDPPSGNPPPGLERTSPPVAIPAHTAEMITLVNETPPDEWGGFSDRRREWLLHPEIRDPLHLFVGDLVKLCAKRAKRDIVGVVPDEMFRTAPERQWNSTVTANQLDQWLRSSCDVEVNALSLIVRPRFPEETRALRMNRRGMAAYLKKVWAQRDFRWLDFSDYLQAQPSNYDGTIGETWLSMACPFNLDPRSRNQRINSIPAARILGALSSEVRSALERGAELPYDRLPRTAQVALDDWVFNGPPGCLDALPYDGFGRDPLDAFRTGNASPSTICLDVNSLPQLVIVRDSGKETRPLKPKNINSSESKDRYRMAWDVTYTLRLRSPVLDANRSLTFSELRIERDGPPLKLDQLPPGVRNAIKTHDR